MLEQLAEAPGIETPTRQDLAKLDRKRPGKGSNKDWEHPHDPEARITRMKDGRTRLAHKLEQAVDHGDRGETKFETYLEQLGITYPTLKRGVSEEGGAGGK